MSASKDMPLHALLTQAAVRWPDKEALVFQDRRYTFADLDRQASQVARGLQGLGLEPGERVATFLPNSPEYEVVFFGISRAGGVPTPLNPSYREREVRHQIGDSGATMVFVHEKLYPTLAAVREDLPQLEHIIFIGDEAPDGVTAFSDFLAGAPDVAPPVELGPDDLAVLPYSSGTTGASKGVMLSQRNIVSSVLQSADAIQTSESDCMLIFLPLCHIYGVTLMSSAICQGAKQVVMERFDMAEVLRLIATEGVTEVYVVPPVIQALGSVPGLGAEQFATLRLIMSAASRLPQNTPQISQQLGVPIIQGYGLSEIPLAHVVRVDRAESDFGSVGLPLANTSCRIVDLETGQQEVPVGETGEILLAGPHVMAGYWNADQETAEALRDGWLYTGDVGSVDDQGRLFISERKKDMIKYKGFSIAPAEVESVLLEHPAVADCAVTGRPDAEAGESPHAYVVLRPGQSASADELAEFVRERVAGYKQIRSLEFIDAVPRTPQGKILRQTLKERAPL